ncbi:putative bifunctional diguanylate cyclase/phosphodiesterase [Deinococcus aquatilis]|uniref:putative bifunctional diguanylate cyclase/phosphodiesterase n=1 Tax=Deinococcus aquatilis TaxID=519440 RepID=UPI000A04504C|nr:GGDEF domain-containing phosphodiesterase [Deinococcus aquatilis]
MKNCKISVIILENSDSQSAERLSKKLLSNLKSEGVFISPGFRYSFLTLSIGISNYPEDAQTPEDLLRHADSAMLAVKRSGKHGFKRYNSTDDAATEYQQMLAHELAGAIERQEISLVFQPIYDLRTAKIVKVESLLRWTHPTLGRISPTDFIPVAEHSGLILSLGHWVIEQACLSASAWKDIQVCVNLSALQLLQHSFMEDLNREIQKNGLSPTHLALEITETMLMRDDPHTRYILDELNSLGIDLIIDDFGIGYSNFNRLRTLPVQSLKIDQSFTFNIVGQSVEHLYVQQIVRSTVNLSQIADLQVTAEGIETAEQLDMVQSLGCHYGQGYLFSRPCSAEQIDVLLAQSELPAWFRPATPAVPPT